MGEVENETENPTSSSLRGAPKRQHDCRNEQVFGSGRFSEARNRYCQNHVTHALTNPRQQNKFTKIFLKR